MEKVKNIPTLRFQDFKGNWETKKLGEVTEYVKGFAFKSEFYTNEGIRIVRVSDLSARSIKHDNDKIFINLNRTKELNKYKIKKGDIIITTVGSKPELLDSAVGRGIFVRNSDEGLLNQNLLKLNKSEKIDNGFLFGYINSEKYISHIKEIQRGNANQSNITVVDLLNYKIHYPTLPEQQKIAAFLTAVDEKLQALKQKKTLLAKYKKGVMQQIFSQDIRFKDDKGNAFADWEEKKLGSISNIKKGKQLNKEELTETGAYLCINGGISPSGYTDNFNTLENTITISEGGNSCGFINFFKCKFWSGGHNYSLEIINPDETDNDFIFQILKQNQPEIMSLRVGSGLPNIQKKDLVAFSLKLPSSIKEQTKIANFLSAIDDKIYHCQAQIANTEVWKKGLLQQLFC